MRTIHNERYRRVISHLRLTRRKRGMTQGQVSQRLGWNRSVLSKIETFERRADILEIFLISEILGVGLSELEPLLVGGGVNDQK